MRSRINDNVLLFLDVILNDRKRKVESVIFAFCSAERAHREYLTSNHENDCCKLSVAFGFTELDPTH